MFTGIIESLGTIVSKHESAGSVVLLIELGELDASTLATGDSIAVNGACLTATRFQDNSVRFDVSPETLSKCLIGEWKIGDKVNLERALTLQKPLGGHLVSGHVDGIGQLIERRDESDSTWMQFETPRTIGRFIAVKGSITIDGISLTSNAVKDVDENTRFEISLVPHTLAMTTLSNLIEGSHVHLEIDLVARYLERMNQRLST